MIHILNAEPSSEHALQLLRHGEMLVLEGVEWEADFSVLRSGLIRRRRGPAEPFGGDKASAVVMAEVAKVARQASAMRERMYPLPCVETDVLYRPMISGPEPMHFDTFSDEAGCWISAFVNISMVPRRYSVGPSLHSLERSAVAQVLKESGGPKRFSYALRQRTVKNLPPLNDATPRREIDLAPGAIWFFNSKTLAHELLYGEGAISIGWLVPGAAPRQAEVLESILA